MSIPFLFVSRFAAAIFSHHKRGKTTQCTFFLLVNFWHCCDGTEPWGIFLFYCFALCIIWVFCCSETFLFDLEDTYFTCAAVWRKRAIGSRRTFFLESFSQPRLISALSSYVCVSLLEQPISAILNHAIFLLGPNAPRNLDYFTITPGLSSLLVFIWVFRRDHGDLYQRRSASRQQKSFFVSYAKTGHSLHFYTVLVRRREGKDIIRT
ncbi:hypothetical protein FB567DRAFT_30625 [Paraphoma chrysanthemicola]|uniref:Uncharacterized protein n=1 Tax=Paraphoma chrysanthemicola TaxID=798071 RepID=A0A8K0RHH3_9PLEO|nr:hypothetical protein FB567DRAFT_30625 [Paraphoma chrysanthemicola]